MCCHPVILALKGHLIVWVVGALDVRGTLETGYCVVRKQARNKPGSNKHTCCRLHVLDIKHAWLQLA